ncbi:MAG TPA: hypothetical protein VGJ00_08560 [Rhabdochlamydiaceae bacterium]|jgi:hypothetical protein
MAMATARRASVDLSLITKDPFHEQNEVNALLNSSTTSDSEDTPDTPLDRLQQLALTREIKSDIMLTFKAVARKLPVNIPKKTVKDTPPLALHRVTESTICEIAHRCFKRIFCC